MKRKGISPLIAAVLLIAFTMAVASLFAQWAPELMEEAQAETQEDAGDLTDCSQLIIDISSADAENATISQTAGTDSIGDIQMTWFYDDHDPVQQTIYEVEDPEGDNEGDFNYTAGETRWSLTVSADSNDLEEGTSFDDLEDEFDYVQANPIDCEGAPSDTFP